MSGVKSFARTIGIWFAAVAGILATASGCISAVSWALGAVGATPVLIAAALVIGVGLGAAGATTLGRNTQPPARGSSR